MRPLQAPCRVAGDCRWGSWFAFAVLAAWEGFFAATPCEASSAEHAEITLAFSAKDVVSRHDMRWWWSGGTPPTPTVGPLVGCFLDNNLGQYPFIDARVLQMDVASKLPPMTHDVCARACHVMGMILFGIQAGNQCFCGMVPNTNPMVDMGNCSTPCKGNSSQACGGSGHTIVYKINSKKLNFVPAVWHTAAYVGNGLVGVQLRMSEDGQSVRMDIGRKDLWVEGQRAPVGKMLLTSEKGWAFAECSMNVTLWDGTLRARFASVGPAGGGQKAEVTLDVLTDASNLTTPIIVFQLSGDVGAFNVSYQPQMVMGPDPGKHLRVSVSNVNQQGHNIIVSQHHFSTPAAAAFMPVVSSPSSTIWYVCVAMRDHGDPPVNDAVSCVFDGMASGPQAIAVRSEAAWAPFWNASVLVLPSSHTAMEGFYVVELFRFFSSSRVGLMGLFGPFGPNGIGPKGDGICIGPWCQYVGDMNIQVTYFPIFQANRVEWLGLPMIEYLNQHHTVDRWMLNNWFRAALHTMNMEMLTDLWNILKDSPLPSKSPGSDGKYHVRNCNSPEYHWCPKTSQSSVDCNFDLAQHRWSYTAALVLAKVLGLEDKPEVAALQHNLEVLAPYPTDPVFGYKLSAGCNLEVQHRHFSHLLMVYDLRVSTDPLAANRALDHWYNVTCAPQQQRGYVMEDCRGFSQIGLGTMSAMLGRREAAVGNLSALIRSVGQPQGMYGEQVFFGQIDEYAPCDESTLAAGAILNEALLSSRHTGDGVELSLLTVPADMCPLLFFNMSGEGGLHVHAHSLPSPNSSCHTTVVQLNAGPSVNVTMSVGSWTDLGRLQPLHTLPSSANVHIVNKTHLSVGLEAGEHVVMYVGDNAPELILPLPPADPAQIHTWGYSRPIPPQH